MAGDKGWQKLVLEDLGFERPHCSFPFLKDYLCIIVLVWKMFLLNKYMFPGRTS